MRRRAFLRAGGISLGVTAGFGLVGYGTAMTVGAPHQPPENDGPVPTRLRPAAMRADIDAFADTVVAVGTDPFLSCPRAVFDAARVHALGDCAREMSVREFWRVAATLAAALNDGHVCIKPTFYENTDDRILPLGTAIDPGNVLIATIDVSGTHAVPAGSQILTLDGIAAGNLVASAIAVRGGQNASVRRAFANVPATLDAMTGPLARHDVRFRTPSGETRTVALAACTAEEWNLRAARTVGPKEPYTFSLLPGSIARIDYNSCEDEPRFKGFLAATFARIRAEKPRAVVVDLRRNGGGDSSLNDDLFAYLTGKPYMQAGTMRVRTSARLRHEYGWVRYAEGYLLAALVPAGTVTNLRLGWPMRPHATPLRYAGRVYYLIGPRTFSSAQMCALAVRDFGLGTLVGEETGEPAVTTGEVYPFTLPNSRLGATATTKTWLPAKPHRVGEGVLPDIVAPATAAQLARGEDPGIEAIRHDLRHRGA